MEAAHVPWRPLGELFVSRGLISEDELETALAEQAATGKRLGEILVDRGLVSGPDLTSALMDQLGVEISKEEGFGSGLWAEIKRRHRRVRHEGEDEQDGEYDESPPELALLRPVEDDTEPDFEPEFEPVYAPEPEPEPEPFALPPAAVAVEAEPVEPVAWEPAVVEPEPVEPVTWEPDVVESEPFAAVDPELEYDLEEIRADYTPPEPMEPFAAPVPEPGAAFAEPEFAQPEPEQPEPAPELAEPEFAEPVLLVSEPAALAPDYEPGPAPSVAVEPVPEPQPEPAPAAIQSPNVEPVGAAVLPVEHREEDTSELRSELEQARIELSQLQEMLADAMTALTALSAEVAPEAYAPERSAG